MRTIAPDVQALLETDLGQEIVVVLEIFWSRGDPNDINAERVWYADRAIPGADYVNANILELSEVDASVQVSQGGQSKSVNVKLDDTFGVGGEVKAIFDTQDIHKVPVRVWFFVMGTDFDTKKFKIFLGQINSPVKWSEGERTLSFQVVNRIEDTEVGFSADEGDFPSLGESLIGQVWPLCFGTTINVPALRAVPAISGSLASGVGIKDFTLVTRIDLAELITCPRTPVGWICTGRAGLSSNQKCNIAYEQDQNCIQARCVEIERLKLELEEQSSYEFSQFIVFGGEQFPQGLRITLNINGGLFTGSFKNGTPTEPDNEFFVTSRRHPLFDPNTGTVLVDEVQAVIDTKCPGNSLDSQDSNFVDIYSGPTWTGIRQSRIQWEEYRRAKAANFFWAQGGSTVTVETVNELVYIANILPSTILRVAAKRTLNGNEFLLTVPSEFFTIRQTDFSGYQVMEIVFKRPLSVESKETGGGWRNEIFVTQTSTIGPNTVDIIRWFIETYTSYLIDDESFDDVKAKLEAYPMNFCLLRRPNLLTILQELSRKARCALWQRDDTFFIKYLAEEPVPVATIGEDDILQDGSQVGTLNIDLTKTLDLVTKQTATWQKDHALPKPNKLILRHNVKKYGTHAKTEDYFPYAHLDLVRKSATFWLIRSANTWKRLTFTTSLEFAFLEPFDAVTFNLPDVGTGPFLGVVERAVLDSKGKEIRMEVWTPIRAGEMTPYDFSFPAFISEQAEFPTTDARDSGQAGSGTEPNFSTLAPPGHPLSIDQGTIFTGISLGCNGDGVVSLKPGECRQDHGDKKPSDIGDKKPTVDVTVDKTGPVSGKTSPVSERAGTGLGSTLQTYQDWIAKTESDAGRAREVAESGGTGDSPGSGDNADEIEVPLDDDFLDSLPDPDDIPETTCKYTVVISGFNTKAIDFNQICIPDGDEFTEIYVWDSLSAAEGFCEGFGGNDPGKEPCLPVVSCSITPSAGCDGTNDGTGNLIAYSGPSSGGGTPFIFA